MTKTRDLVLVLGDQLTPSLTSLAACDLDQDRVLMAELITTAARTAEILLNARGHASLINNTSQYGCGRRKPDEHLHRRASKILDRA